MSSVFVRLNQFILVRGLPSSTFRTCLNCSERKFHGQVRVRERILQDFQGKYRKFAGTAAMSTITGHDIIFRQFIEYRSFTYTYLLADPKSKEAILIDPVVDTVERDVKVIKDLDLKLIYGVNTHVHADHITGTGKLKKLIPTCESVISEASSAVADITLIDGQILKFGKYELEARSTPGHTDGCMTFVLHKLGMIFSGDAVLVRGCGRTDFQQGDSRRLYNSVHTKIFSLPGHFTMHPGHDYTGQTMTTVKEELMCNPRLTKNVDDFVEIMENLKLPTPKQIDAAVPANLLCGIQDE